MQSSNIPSKIPLPFANAAGGSYINTIPTASQIGITNGKASLADGFPPLTFSPISSGGVPPFGADFNGILNEITSIQQWQEAGGFFPYDSTFSTAIGGYPLGAAVQSSTHAGFWVNTVENNTSNPDTGGAGWVPDTFYGTQSIALSGASVTLTNLQAAYPIIKLTGTLTSNCNLILPNFAGKWILVNNTIGAYTVQAKTSAGTGVNIVQGYSTYVYGDTVNIYFANSAAVTSFNSRTGTISLNATDVTSALGFAPIPQFSGLGFNGETWHSVSKSIGTTYTNSYSYPIMVNIAVTVSGPSNPSFVVLYVNGVQVGEVYWSVPPNAGGGTLSAIVPPLSTYYCTGSGNYGVSSWAELY